MYSFSRLNVLTLISQTTIVSKNPLFYLFPIQKHQGSNLTLPSNRSRSTQGHQLNKLGSTRVPDAAYQLSRSLAFWFQRRRFLRFLPYMGMAAILVMWHRSFEQTFIPLYHGGSIWNLASIGLEVSKEKKFENVNLSYLGWRSMNDFDLWYSHRFMYWFS